MRCQRNSICHSLDFFDAVLVFILNWCDKTLICAAFTPAPASPIGARPAQVGEAYENEETHSILQKQVHTGQFFMTIKEMKQFMVTRAEKNSCFRWLKERNGRICQFVILSLLFTLLCSNSLCLTFWKMSAYQLGVYWPYSILAFIIHFGFWLSFLFLCARSWVSAYILMPLVVLTQFLVVFADMGYGAACEEIAVGIINATGAEVLNYTSKKAELCLVLGVLFVYFVAFYVRKLLAFEISRRVWLIQVGMGVGFSLFFLLVPQVVKWNWQWAATESVGFVDTLEPWRREWPIPQTREQVLHDAAYNPQEQRFDKSYQPVNVVINFYTAIYDYYNPETLLPVESVPSRQVWADLPQSVVLYISESVRADHFPLNGYHRNTMPGIIKEANLINLPVLHARETQTITSIYSILTLTDSETGKATHDSFLGILKKHGFSLNLLVGANTEGMWYNAPSISPLMADRMSLHSRPASPEEYAEAMKAIMPTGKRHFILIEDGAGHMPYHSESLVKPFGEKEKIDCYDNTLLDIDRRVCAIIDTMRDKEALLFFTSDHGESFGENNRWGHGGPAHATEQIHVCAYIWYSDMYAEKHPEVIEALRKNAGNFTSVDHIYHTIISLCGLKSDVQIPEQDMTIYPLPEKQ